MKSEYPLLPRIHPLQSAISFEQFAVHFRFLFIPFSCFNSFIQFLNVFDHDTIAILFEKCVFDVLLRWFTIWEADGCDFDEMFYLPQSSVVLWDIFDDCNVGSLEIKKLSSFNSSHFGGLVSTTHIIIKQSNFPENPPLPVWISFDGFCPLDTEKLGWMFNFRDFFLFISRNWFELKINWYFH